MAEFLLLVVKPASQPLPKTPVSESSGYSYATGGYFVGVLPVRYCLTPLSCNLVVVMHNVNNFMWFD
ncbi:MULTISPECIES: hypothetical protein [Citrobacter]|uniref:hypothetical protein n=1 Tax=Citrobacter TaxID=544 RepID=UPI0015E90606|nr:MULTISPECIES: hypothetical protein [Citrobacter]MDT7061962.1 hypothetical protein [Citrobacter braakii]QLS64191.1 hypothetical protein HV311_06090 [Citrobacter sp. RHBSTW-00881]